MIDMIPPPTPTQSPHSHFPPLQRPPPAHSIEQWNLQCVDLVAGDIKSEYSLDHPQMEVVQ